MMGALLDIVRAGIGGVLAAIGFVLITGGAIGLLRFPDVYTRLHAVRVADGPGAALVLLGLAVVAPDWTIAVRLVLLAALVAALAPTLAHLAANAAHAGGLAPLSGRYVAPRPGARREGVDT